MKLTEEQKRLVHLEYERQTTQIGAGAKRQLDDVKRRSLNWAPNDPKFFASCAQVFIERTPDYLWARANILLQVSEDAGLLGDEECFHELLKDVRTTARGLAERGRTSAIGEPIGDYSQHIQSAVSRTLVAVEKEIERQYLMARSKTPSPQTNAKQPSTWVLTLHGIRTRGAWQKNLVPALNQAGFRTVPLDYGFFWALQLVMPSLRSKKVDWFREQYTRHVNERGTVPSIVAHSFGTYIVARALERYPEIRFERIIFAGSIVSEDFAWTRYVPSNIETVLNDCGSRDIWAAVAPWLIQDAGASGRSGFSDTANAKVINRTRSSFGHSDHFYDLNYIKSWVPFLQGGEVVQIPVSSQASRNGRFRITRGIAIALIVGLLAAIPLVRKRVVDFARAVAHLVHSG